MSTVRSRAKRRRKNWVLILAVLVIMFFARWSVTPERNSPEQHDFYVQAPSPLVIAHRGGAHLRPENTLAAFAYAQTLGVDVLEMDVRRSADGELMVIHDATVDRTTNGQGQVAQLTVAQLQALDAGYFFMPPDVQQLNPSTDITYPWRNRGVTVPSLAQVLAEFPHMRMNIEIKPEDPSVGEQLCEVLGQERADRVVVAAFSHAQMLTFRESCPGYLASASSFEATQFVVLQFLGMTRLFDAPVTLLSLPQERYGIDLIRPSLVKRARDWQLTVDYWTLNDPAVQRSAIASGARGVITDRPDVLLDELGRLDADVLINR